MDKPDTHVFEEAVRDCLAHLYDYTFLQDHPLVRLLVPQLQGNADRVQTFREVIFEAIDHLKLHDLKNIQTKNSRLYYILQLRYQQQQQVQYVLKQLNLGERQFYRDHAKAVQALSRVLDEQLKENIPGPINNPSIQSELERVQRQSTSFPTTASAFLEKTLLAVKGLTERQQVELHLHISDSTLPVNIDQTSLRQIIIWIVSQLIVQSPSASHFTVSFSVHGSTAQFSFAGDATSSSVSSYRMQDRQASLETLLKTLGASVYERANPGKFIEVILEIPFQQRSILIIDDNPDAVALFRQHLVGQPFQIFTAYEGAQAIELARESRPEFIILDVLLPNQDGWEILQHLKSHPATMNIPVLICSVLDAFDLAILLGADGFLRKPPEKTEFLNTLKRFSTQV
jgi:CheY-like chemotaxis protein